MNPTGTETEAARALLPEATPTEAAPTVEPQGRSFDERVFIGVVMLGVIVIGAVTTASIVHSRRNAHASAASGADLIAPSSARHLIDFTLTDRSGRTVKRPDLDGQFLVVNFVFASCSLSCLQVNYRMAEVQRMVSSQSDVRLVSLTIDPRSDTPPVLAKFAERFAADTNRWLFLTGDKQVLYRLIEKSFLGPADPRLSGLVPGGFVNTDRVVIVDPRGQVRAILNGMKTSAPREVMETITKLRSENAKR